MKFKLVKGPTPVIGAKSATPKLLLNIREMWRPTKVSAPSVKASVPVSAMRRTPFVLNANASSPANVQLREVVDEETLSTCTRQFLKDRVAAFGLDPRAKKMGDLREMLTGAWKEHGLV